MDVVMPVPLHRSKRAFRGFNQAMVVARALGAQLGKPAEEDLLLRVRETESQTNKSRVERVNNMAGAFKVATPGSLANKHVLLVDDVLTTGATLEACATAILTGENAKISFATIAIAVS